MSEKIENLNKQIASFIIVSVALAIPSSAENLMNTNNNLVADASINMPSNINHHEIIAMYAAPQIPIGEIKPTPIIEAPIISMYAAPQFPIGEIRPVPIQPPGAISMYAAPQHPIIEPQPVPMPLLRYAAPDIMIQPLKPIKFEKNLIQKDSPALNESSLNINNLKPAANINTATSIKNTAGSFGNGGFVMTDYGNVKIIEPFSHIIFK